MLPDHSSTTRSVTSGSSNTSRLTPKLANFSRNRTSCQNAPIPRRCVEPSSIAGPATTLVASPQQQTPQHLSLSPPPPPTDDPPTTTRLWRAPATKPAEPQPATAPAVAHTPAQRAPPPQAGATRVSAWKSMMAKKTATAASAATNRLGAATNRLALTRRPHGPLRLNGPPIHSATATATLPQQFLKSIMSNGASGIILAVPPIRGSARYKLVSMMQTW